MASEDIQSLDIISAIRLRPGMYLSSIEDASIALREVIDNAVDESYRCKTADTIEVMFDKKSNSYMVCDNGRGIPVKASTVDPDTTMTVESLSKAHSGSKFDNLGKISIGQNGIGTKAVNALSEYYEVYSRMCLQDFKSIPERLQKIYNKENYYYCRFEKGIFKSDGFKNLKSHYSTIVRFKPDSTIFEDTSASMPVELKYVKCIAKLIYNKNLNILLNGKEYNVGLVDHRFNIKLEGKCDINSYTILAGISIKDQYEFNETEGSVNGLSTNHGLHIRWLHRAFAKAFNQMYGTNYDVDEIVYGTNMRVIMLASEPIFSGQIKDNLVGIKGFPSKGEAESDKLILPILKELKKDRKYWDIHLKRIKSLVDAKNKNDIKQLVKDTFDVDGKKKKNLPSKLMDCTTKNRKEAILYITEGNSASAGLIKSRDSKIHAILSLRGKMLNTVGKSVDEVIGNQEVRDLINAIGIGTKDYSNIRKLRYGKILIASDADSDGNHICNLVLGCLYTHIPMLFTCDKGQSIVYRVDGPLYKVGNDFYYTENLNGIDTKGKLVERYKGLGSLDSNDLGEALMNPTKWHLTRITMKDCEEATNITLSSSLKGELLEKAGVIKY